MTNNKMNYLLSFLRIKYINRDPFNPMVNIIDQKMFSKENSGLVKNIILPEKTMIPVNNTNKILFLFIKDKLINLIKFDYYTLPPAIKANIKKPKTWYQVKSICTISIKHFLSILLISTLPNSVYGDGDGDKRGVWITNL